MRLRVGWRQWSDVWGPCVWGEEGDRSGKDFHPGWVDSVGRREVGKCIYLESGVVSTENPELEVCPRAA